MSSSRAIENRGWPSWAVEYSKNVLVSCSEIYLEAFTRPLSATKHDASVGRTLRFISAFDNNAYLPRPPSSNGLLQSRCWCSGCDLTDNDTNTDYDRHEGGECTAACAGDSSMACGGDMAFNLYQTNSCGEFGIILLPRLTRCCLLLFLTFSVLVINPNKLPYTVAIPRGGLLITEKRIHIESLPPPPQAARTEEKRR